MSRKDLLLEQAALGEILEGQTMLQNEQELLEHIKKSNEQILSEYPAVDMKFAVLSKMAQKEEKPRKIRTYFTVQSIMAAAAVLCFALLIPLGLSRTGVFSGSAGDALSNPFSIEGASERVKGNGSKLFVYRQDGKKAVRLKTLAHVDSGDVLQVSYIAAGASYGFIFSVDGNGTLTQHFPDKGKEAGLLNVKGEVPLDFSYKLDDAPGFERFFLVTSASVFSTSDIAPVLNAVKTAGAASNKDFSEYLPKGTSIQDILLLK
jgi:hypothetical protein